MLTGAALEVLAVLYDEEELDLLEIMTRTSLGLAGATVGRDQLVDSGVVAREDRPLGDGSFLQVYRVSDRPAAALALGRYLGAPGKLTRPSALASG